ncbi:MAG: hypothetical protein GDA36_06745 [Rhodobacteraceae bacterium]|nr:hypothetical protein [Paracoccaceae bacterium]
MDDADTGLACGVAQGASPVSLDDLLTVIRESRAPGWTVACTVYGMGNPRD